MTTDRLLEERLRQRFADHAPPSAVNESFVSHTLQRAQKRKRRRVARNAVALTGAAALTAAAIVGISAGFLTSSKVNTHQGPVSPPTTDESMGLMAWAEELPRGSDTSLIYLANKTLHTPGAQIAVAGTDVGYFGEVMGGLLVLVEHEVSDPYSFASEYEVIDDKGAPRALPVSDFQAQGAVISPDRTQVAYGRVIYDLTTDGVVARLPSSAAVLDAWTDNGIIFLDKSGDGFIWQVGETPLPVKQLTGSVLTPEGLGVRTQQGCAEVFQIDGGGKLSAVLRDCSAAPFVSLSPDGAFVLTQRLQILSVDGLNGTPVSPRVAGRLDGHSAVGWEPTGDVVFTVEGPATNDTGLGARGTRPTLLVRCDPSNGNCERASDQLRIDADGTLQFQ